MSSQRERKKQKQRQEQKKRSLHKKHKDRRKKDLTNGLPFIIAYHGDPAMGMGYFYCNDLHSYKLIAPKDRYEKAFARLKRYQKKPIASMFKLEGKILVKEAI